jgi:ATP-dependent Clp protease ATP-binding subunit ClpC
MTLTPRAKKALQFAVMEARNLGHPCAGSQHLLLGLSRLGSGVHFSILQSHGLTPETLVDSVGYLGPVAEQTQEFEGFVVGESIVRALERASMELPEQSFTYLGTEHLLLGLLAEELGAAATLFAAHQLDTASARRQIRREYGTEA